MNRATFFYDNILKVLDSSGVLIDYGLLKDYSLGEILASFPDLDNDSRRELFLNVVDLLEARVFMRLLSSEDASLIGKVSGETIRLNFQIFKDLIEALFSDVENLRDYKVNFEIINKLKKSLVVIEGGKS